MAKQSIAKVAWRLRLIPRLSKSTPDSPAFPRWIAIRRDAISGDGSCLRPRGPRAHADKCHILLIWLSARWTIPLRPSGRFAFAAVRIHLWHQHQHPRSSPVSPHCAFHCPTCRCLTQVSSSLPHFLRDGIRHNRRDTSLEEDERGRSNGAALTSMETGCFEG